MPHKTPGMWPAMSYADLLDHASKSVAGALRELGIDNDDYTVEIPSKPGFGDVSCNVAFLAAKAAHRAPREIAVDIAKECRPTDLIERIEAHGSGHINFFANVPALNRSVITSALDGGSFAVDVGHGSKVAIEHTSVNPNKALHIGHMRNVVIGDVISRILKSTNHRVRVLNYVDDMGLQVAELVLGFAELGFSESDTGGKRFDQYCGDVVYVKASEKIKADPALKAKSMEILEAMEDQATDLAQTASRISHKILRSQLDTCWRIGARYDCLNFESHIVRSGMWARIFADLQKGSMVRLETEGKNAGCWIVPGSAPEDDKVLVRSNGVATYIAKDIPYAAWKLGKIPDPFGYEPCAQEQPDVPLLQTSLSAPEGAGADLQSDRVITVIDSRQTRLQTIITALLAKFFGATKQDYVHLAYESVTLSAETAAQMGQQTGGKNVQMSGRSGLFVNAVAVLDMLQERARAETLRRNPEMGADELDRVSEQIAVGAMRYEMIRQDLDKVITFDLASSMRLDGDTSSYIQYAHARAVRILQKADRPGGGADYASLCGAHERDLVRAIGTLGLSLRDSAVNLSPKVVARYARDLTVAFNAFYEHVRVIGSSEADPVTVARIELVDSFRAALAYALGLLGIPAPPRM